MTLKDLLGEGNWTMEIKDIYRIAKDGQEIILWIENEDKAKKQDLQTHETDKENL